MENHTSHKPLILIDGSSYLYRAFHALPALTNSRGEPTGAVYGVLNMIRKLIADYDPDHIAVIFDTKGKTFRDEIFPQYKAHRPPMPEELRSQIQPLHDAIKAMGLPLIAVEGIEADDIIATLAHQAAEKNWQTIISTGDKDLAQLVNDQIILINTMTGVTLDRAGVINKFGVPPEKIIDYLALIGDSVDNIPGVPKVGPKTAVKWLQEYNSLDEIIAHADKFTGKIGENLRQSIANLPLSKRLVTLRTDEALPFMPDSLHKQSPNQSQLIELFKQLEFKSWLKELLEKQIPEEPIQLDYQTIVSKEAFETWLERLKQADSFAFDTETTSLNTIDAQIVGISFAIHPNQAAYVPMAHNYIGAPEQLSREYVLAQIKPLLESPHKTIIGQNLKFDMGVLANYGIEIKAPFFDTMLESYILDSASNRHNLNSLALKYLGKNTISFEEIAGKGSKQITFNQISIADAAPYAAEDADIVLQIHENLWPKIVENPTVKNVLLDIELPLIPVLLHIERNGVMIDCDLLATQSKEISERLATLEAQAFQLADAVFNLSSPKQLQEILYEKLKLPILEKTPTGVPSTAEPVLQELALNFPLPKLILEYRSLSKLKSTYTDSLPKQINPKTARIHTCYNQAVTSTGRLSSTDPNLQNIPVRHEEGRRIRQAFIAPPGYKIISADYSQIELRIMAHLSEDPGLLTAFANDLDIHTATAAEVFGVSLDEVNSDQRRSAKAINFGLIYGMSAFGLAKQLGIERGLAQAYIDKYFTRYPNVQYYMDAIRNLAYTQGYVETLFGRRLYIPDIKSSQVQRRRGAERAAINAPMQGTAADIIKMAMIHLDNFLPTTGLDIKMIMQVHDELVFEVAEKDVEQAIKHIQHGMTSAVKLSVPLIVHISSGNNWDEAH